MTGKGGQPVTLRPREARRTVGAGKEQNVAGGACIGCLSQMEDLRLVACQILGSDSGVVCSA